MLVRDAAGRGADIGTPDLLRRYERAHRLATRPLFTATNLLTELYAEDRPAARLARHAALRMDHVPFVQRGTSSMLMQDSPLPAWSDRIQNASLNAFADVSGHTLDETLPPPMNSSPRGDRFGFRLAPALGQLAYSALKSEDFGAGGAFRVARRSAHDPATCRRG